MQEARFALRFSSNLARIPPAPAQCGGRTREGGIPWALFVGWVFTLAVLIFAIPIFHYRASFVRTKRLREVTPGVFYRSGQMTVEGYEDAVERLHIRTIINLRDEAPDPDVRQSYLNGHTEKESALSLGWECAAISYLPI